MPYWIKDKVVLTVMSITKQFSPWPVLMVLWTIVIGAASARPLSSINSVPPAPSVYSVKLGGEGHVPIVNSDGLPFKDAQGDTITEIRNGWPPSAAKRNKSLSITLKITNNGPEWEGDVSVDVFFTHDFSQGSVTPSSRHITIPANSFGEAVFTIDAVPDAVYWQWAVLVNVNFDGMSQPNLERDGVSYPDFPLFIIHDSPSSPQTTPWYGVLHDACGWADSKTDLSNIRNAITDGFYGSGTFTYSSDTASYYSISPGYTSSGGFLDAAYKFRLKEFFIYRINYPQSIFSVNCHDVSNYLSICFAATGSAPSFITMRKMNGNNAFTASSLVPIGGSSSSPTNPTWNNHQVTGISSSSEETYDSCLALVTAPDGTPSGIPAHGLNIDSYWQNAVNGNYYGLVQSPAPFVLSSMGQSFTRSVVLIN